MMGLLLFCISRLVASVVESAWIVLVRTSEREDGVRVGLYDVICKA